MSALFDLTGRVAVVTGGGLGIGRAIALGLAEHGADVVVCDINDSALDETGAHLAELGSDGAIVHADIAEPADIHRLFQLVDERLGRVDILVNNAAYQMAQPGGIADITTEQFDRVMKTNLYAMFWLCKMALPHMTSGSSIINTTSVQSSSPSPELLDYATTKAGIVNFTRGLATMVAADGIRVNAVAPGPIWTPLIPATMPEEKIESFGQQTPLGRVGQPAELAPAYVFLASAEASYITAEVIAVTGGMPVPV